MRKLFLIIFSLVICGGLLIACSSQKELSNAAVKTPSNITAKEQDVRESVWNQLTSEEKERMKGSWQDSKVHKLSLKESMGIINDKSYIGKEVYFIDFTTKDISRPNHFVVYASIDNHKIIGIGYVK